MSTDDGRLPRRARPAPRRRGGCLDPPARRILLGCLELPRRARGGDLPRLGGGRHPRRRGGAAPADPADRARSGHLGRRATRSDRAGSSTSRRHLNRVLEIDPVARTARVQPGVVHGRAAAPRRRARAALRAGSLDPGALHDRRDDRQQRLRTPRRPVGSHGRQRAGAADDRRHRPRRRRRRPASTRSPALEDLVRRHLATIRTEFGRFGRQVSGYSLEHLLPETRPRPRQGARRHRGHLRDPPRGDGERSSPSLAPPRSPCSRYPDMPTAADDVGALLPLRPLAIESMDRYLVEVVERHHGSVPALPEGGALALRRDGGRVRRARRSPRRSGSSTRHRPAASRVLPAGEESRELWRIREDGVGLAGRTPAGEPAWPGWEDAAVPPERLGAYLRDFEALKLAHGVQGLSYGHVGDGCIHTRLDLPIAEAPDALPALPRGLGRPRRRGTAARCRASTATGARAASCCRGCTRRRRFGRSPSSRRSSTPTGILNPGVIVDPASLTADLRLPLARPIAASGLRAPARTPVTSPAPCTDASGVGKCRADNTGAGGFMCPSYLATRDEKDSTRGRARVLQEMANGTLVQGGWASDEVAESLDLCLSCKACSSDCPAGVDMATYKSEALYRRYRGRLRPMSHYTLGWLPRWMRLAAVAPRVVNALARVRPLVRLGPAARGRRPAPRGARAARAHVPRRCGGGDRRPQAATGRRVALWLDSFTNGFSPEIAVAAVAVLEDAGYEVVADPAAGVLRADLDHDGPARRRPPAAALEPGRARAAPRRGRADRRARAVVHRGAALGCRRAAARRSARASGRAQRLHPRRVPRIRRCAACRALDAAVARRSRGARAAALPPARGHGLGGRRAAAHGVPAPTCAPSRDAAGSRATSAWSRATTRCRSPWPSAASCPRCASIPSASCSRTGSRAAPRRSSSARRSGRHLAQLLAEHLPSRDA